MAYFDFYPENESTGLGRLSFQGDIEIVGEVKVPYPADIRLVLRDTVIEYQEKTTYHESSIRLESESGKIYQNGNLMADHFLDEFRARIDEIVSELDHSPHLKIIKNDQ